MTDDTATQQSTPAAPVLDEVHDEEGHLRSEWVDRLKAEIAAEDAAALAVAVEPLHAADVGELLETLSREERGALVHLLGERFDFSALTEVDETVRGEILGDIPNDEIARGVSDLSSDDAVYILEDMDAPDREAVLEQLPAFERLSLRRSLDFPEESAGRLMQTDFIAIPPFWTVGQTIDYLRSEEELPNEFYQIYVVDPGYNLLGTLPLDHFIRSKRQVRIEKIMNTNVFEIDANEDQEKAARTFERYDLVEVGVVDENRRLVGVLTIDDMVDVIHREATEDFQRLVGVGNEEVSAGVWATLRGRLTWLFVNLLTAILASSVIDVFDGTIAKMVALAVLMPIVASMGGNAATQTMTITVRALATHDLGGSRLRRLVAREIAVGVANGISFAVIMGIVADLWFQNWGLGAVMGLALIVNLFAAGLAGVLIPLGLNKLKVDPAIASTAFVTTVTDVVGFFSFLWFAGLWFHLFR
ncbi:MAG TPA: magnesium transporter [Devosia sp.]|nr:magnesium transporter [Devosia sp.]